MKNIVLIGMPGAGKSTVGVVLAKVLGYDFLDSDLVIQQKDGRLLSQIIAEEGTDGFIRIENQVNAGLDVMRSVIATGGSVVYGTEAMEHLKSIGTVVYLKLTYQTIENRLGDLKNRGVVLREGQTLADLYRERTSLYEKYADVTIEEDGLSIPETVSKIAAAYKEKQKDRIEL